MKVSVIVLNRDRDAELIRCLMALSQQYFRDFELVVVTNRPNQVPFADRLRIVAFNEANVSAARNAGIAGAAGDILAFCDDDAVPEPTWLGNLVKPFSDERLGGVGGLVRGRNGISLQWGPQEVDCYGNDWPHVGKMKSDRCLKTVGTNCAFRREALDCVHGFDESFRYFLDETDVNWRLAQAGWSLEFVSDAEVHHRYARNATRSSRRVPRDLFEIGASKSYFCFQHGQPDQIEAELQGFRESQTRKLHKAMHLGLIEPNDIAPALATLDKGMEAGRQRVPTRAEASERKKQQFHAFPRGPVPEPEFRTCGYLTRKRGRADAAAAANNGKLVTLFDLSPTPKMASVRYDPAGYWHHTGGVFGRTERNDRLFRLRSSQTWVQAERQRIETVRTG